MNENQLNFLIYNRRRWQLKFRAKLKKCKIVRSLYTLRYVRVFIYLLVIFCWLFLTVLLLFSDLYVSLLLECQCLITNANNFDTFIMSPFTVCCLKNAHSCTSLPYHARLILLRRCDALKIVKIYTVKTNI